MPYADPTSKVARECTTRAGRKYYRANRKAEIARCAKWNREHQEHVNRRGVIRRKKLPMEQVLYNNAKMRSKAQGVPFDLKVSDIVVPEQCPILGLILVVATSHAKDNSPSLDRINPSFGYVVGNIQVISHKANTIKSNATPEDLRKVADYMEKIMAKEPRGLRNKNPGNIDYNEAQFIRDRWVGEIGLEKHPRARFTTFETHEYGIRAMTKILLTYHHKRKAVDGSRIDTVQEIIDRWAPPVENDTDAYANRVRKLLGVSKGEKINLDDRKVMLPLLKAIIKHENGQQPYSDKTILAGMKLAGL